MQFLSLCTGVFKAFSILDSSDKFTHTIPKKSHWVWYVWTLDPTGLKHIGPNNSSAPNFVFLSQNIGPESSISGFKVQAQGPAIPKCQTDEAM